MAGERSERERTYLNPDGTYTTRFYTESVNFRAKDGSWKPIDTTLVPQESSGPSTMSAGEEGWETGSTEAQIEFGGTADADPVVRMQVDEGVSVGYGVDDAHPVAGQAEDSTLTYENARPNADVEFIAGSDSVKETLVLKDANAPAEWRFPWSWRALPRSSMPTAMWCSSTLRALFAPGPPRAGCRTRTSPPTPTRA